SAPRCAARLPHAPPSRPRRVRRRRSAARPGGGRQGPCSSARVRPSRRCLLAGAAPARKQNFPARPLIRILSCERKAWERRVRRLTKNAMVSASAYARSTMKIVSFGDVHMATRNLERMGEVMRDTDLVIISGDLTNFGGEADARKVIDEVRE